MATWNWIFPYVLVLVSACAALDAPCPCGGEWRDSRSGKPHAGASAIAHSKGDHCICQCDGEGEELYMPPFETDCRAFEGACRTQAGRHASLLCR